MVRGLVNNFADGGIVRDEEVLSTCNSVLSETLRTIPGHVVQSHECAIGKKKVIQHTAADNDVVGTFNDRGKGFKGRRKGLIAAWEECIIAADGIVCRWSVDCLLHSRVIEVIVRTLVKVSVAN